MEMHVIMYIEMEEWETSTVTKEEAPWTNN